MEKRPSLYCKIYWLKLVNAESTQGEHLSPQWRLLFGAVAGLVGQTSSYPLDIARRRFFFWHTLGFLLPHVNWKKCARLQTNRVDTHFLPDGTFNSSLRNLIKLMIHIARTEGIIGGLYKGLSMNMFKVGIFDKILASCWNLINIWFCVIHTTRITHTGSDRRRRLIHHLWHDTANAQAHAHLQKGRRHLVFAEKNLFILTSARKKRNRLF